MDRARAPQAPLTGLQIRPDATALAQAPLWQQPISPRSRGLPPIRATNLPFRQLRPAPMVAAAFSGHRMTAHPPLVSALVISLLPVTLLALGGTKMGRRRGTGGSVCANHACDTNHTDLCQTDRHTYRQAGRQAAVTWTKPLACQLSVIS